MKRIAFFLSLSGVVTLGCLFGAHLSLADVYYGVNIDQNTNQVGGYAWNDGVGWFDFNGVTYDPSTGKLGGNAQIVQLNNEGLDGTLSMQGDCVPSCGGYGVVVQTDGSVTGEAWNDHIGWVQFSTSYGGVTNDFSQTPSLTGWAWNDNTGWISISNPAPLPSITDCKASPFNTCLWSWSDNVGWISQNSVDDPSTPVFGVNIDPDTSVVTGYAWNDYLQYIDFSGATYDPGTGELSGTAQINGLGAGGTVTLRGDCSPSCGGYGVSIQPDGTFSGFAWNDTTGWIDFAPTYGGVHYADKQVPSVYGWAWNDSYGWIAFRFTDYDVQYGVNVNEDNTITGYAWSSDIGWIDYAPSGPYPSDPQHAAQWDPSTEKVSGWAKFLSIDAAGGDGWINLRDDSGPIPYGVSINKSTGRWSGYAWNSAIGWIQYNHAFGSVVTNFSGQPPATPVLIHPVNCVDTYTTDPANPLSPSLAWSDYTSFDGSTQTAYQIQVDTDPLFGAPFIDQVVNDPGALYNVGLGLLSYNVTYYWRVRVQNSNNVWTDWGEQGSSGQSNCFQTPQHAPPSCDFTMDPASPAPNQETQFTDKTVVYGGTSILKWAWDFGDGTTISGTDPNTDQNPKHTYTDQGQVPVSLTVTDFQGYECTKTTNASVQLQLPEFRRVIPR